MTKSILIRKDDKFSFIHSAYKESRNNLAGMSVLKLHFRKYVYVVSKPKPKVGMT